MNDNHDDKYGAQGQDYTGAGIPFSRNLQAQKKGIEESTLRTFKGYLLGKIEEKDWEECLKMNAPKLGQTTQELELSTQEKYSKSLRPENNPELNQGNTDYIPSESDSLNPN